MAMQVLSTPAGVVKRASTAEERRALGREAEVLVAVAHPGVVRLLEVASDPPEQLILERASGGTLAEAFLRPVTGTAGWAAALATTVADLHDLGWVHGSLSADHVVLDGQGRPLLCSFGRARRLAGLPGPQAEDLLGADVDALARLIVERLPPGADRRLRRALISGARRSSSRFALGRRQPLTARRIARIVATRVGEVPQPPPAPEHPAALATARRLAPRIGAARRWRPAFIAGALGVGLAVYLMAASGGGHQWVKVTLQAGGDRYSLAIPVAERAVTAFGRWGCAAQRLAVLDIRSGWLWSFGGWPRGRSVVVGRVIGRVAGASGLAAVRSGSGCDRLEVLRGAKRPLLVDLTVRRR